MLTDMIVDMLEQNADDWYSNFIKGKEKYEHNMIHPYFALYEMLCNEQKAISKYEKAILKI